MSPNGRYNSKNIKAIGNSHDSRTVGHDPILKIAYEDVFSNDIQEEYTTLNRCPIIRHSVWRKKSWSGGG